MLIFFDNWIRYKSRKGSAVWTIYPSKKSLCFGRSPSAAYRITARQVMIPYDASKGMTSKAIVEKYHVTKQSADYRVKQDRQKK